MAHADYAAVPVVIISAAPPSTVAELGLEASDYRSFLRKPVDPDVLTSTVAKLIST